MITKGQNSMKSYNITITNSIIITITNSIIITITNSIIITIDANNFALGKNTFIITKLFNCY